MKRLPGVIASAIVLILVSLLPLMMAMGMTVAGVVMRHLPATQEAQIPSWIAGVMALEGVFFLLVGLWGWITAYGLFRMRRWARISMLVIGGGLALCSLLAAAVTLALCFAPLPGELRYDASTHGMMQGVLIAIALFELVLMAIGIWWLVYFLRRKVVLAFAAGAASLQPSRRPLLVALLAAFNALGVFFCIPAAFLPMPAYFLGALLWGWKKALLYLLFGAATVASAYGLWMLREWGRRLAIAWQILGAAQVLACLLFPARLLVANRAMTQGMGLPAQSSPDPAFEKVMMSFGLSVSLLLLLATLWMLHYYRAAFQPLAATEEAQRSEAVPQ